LTSATQRDYYDVLGIGRESNDDQVRRAFRMRARVLHPDVSQDPEANAKFAELAEAYDILSKSTSRLLYDRFGYRGRGEFAAVEAGTQQLFDFLESTGRQRRRSVGELRLTQYEAERGTRRVVEHETLATCATCAGSGAAAGSSSHVCTHCGGRGRTRHGSTMAGDRMLQIDTCLKCGGNGRIVSDPCPACDGKGRSTLRAYSEVAVPPGTVDGRRLVVSGDDTPSYVVVRVRALPDTLLIRRRAIAGLVLACLLLLIVIRL
jgi:molecular chaperone DnaJ